MTRNLKKGAKLPIKEGLNDQHHKVCMEHWNATNVDKKTRKSSKRKERENEKSLKEPTRKKKARYTVFLCGLTFLHIFFSYLITRRNDDLEAEAFLENELAGKKTSGLSELDNSGDEESLKEHFDAGNKESISKSIYLC